MSQKLDTSPAVIGIDIGKNSRNVGSDKLTETREMTPYLWVHPDEER